MLVTVCMGNFRRASRKFTVNTRHASFLWVFFSKEHLRKEQKLFYLVNTIDGTGKWGEIDHSSQYERAQVHIHEEYMYTHAAQSVPSTPFPPTLPGRFSGIRQVFCSNDGEFDIKVHPRVGNLLTLRDTTEIIWWEDTVFVLFTLYMNDNFRRQYTMASLAAIVCPFKS